MLNKIFGKKKTVNHEELFSEWEKAGRPVPPPHIVKQKTINEYKNKYHLNTLVETGTYLGDMVEAQLTNFDKIYSIELSNKLFLRAKKRFKDKVNIFLLSGDSGIKLNELVPQLDEPALFWLDGHYSGGITALGEKECPVLEEINAILKSSFNHVILIDDARLFTGQNDYPTQEEIMQIFDKKMKAYNIETKDDIIRLTPKAI